MSTDVNRFYAALEVDPAASVADIRVAFRRRAKELHPDAQSGDASAFILLKRAYDTLLDPERRAAYDLACQPARPFGSKLRPPSSYRPMPPVPPPPSKLARRGGVGLVRYAIAFLIMAAISLGGVQAMISLTEAPRSVQTRATPRAETSTPTASSTVPEAPSAPGSTSSGFWDPTPPTAGQKSSR